MEDTTHDELSLFKQPRRIPVRPRSSSTAGMVKPVHVKFNKHNVNYDDSARCSSNKRKIFYTTNNNTTNYAPLLMEVAPADQACHEFNKKRKSHGFLSSLSSLSPSSSSSCFRIPQTSCSSHGLADHNPPMKKKQKQPHKKQYFTDYDCLYCNKDHKNELKKAGHGHQYGWNANCYKNKEDYYYSEVIRKQRLQKQREAARIAIDAIQKTVDFNDGVYVMKEFQKLVGLPHPDRVLTV